jgi:lysyl-tRNA synthetase class 2
VTAGSSLWRPSASLDVLRKRARLLNRIRGFFLDAEVLEVATPACSFHGSTAPGIASMTTRYVGPVHPAGRTLYLHTSPEFAMKRLLTAGSGPIYQICQVFRNGELGRFHQPEFTLLEWYRPGFDHYRLMDEVAALVGSVSDRPLPERRLSYAELFLEHLEIDPHRAEPSALRAHALELKVPGADTLELAGSDAWLDLLLTHCIEPRLPAGTLTFVYDYPASQAALARIRPGDPPVAERFELYLGGMELANGFHELADADEQRERFRRELAARQAQGQEPIPMDFRFLAALKAGLPDCAGVALGVDRLLMWLTGSKRIEQVLSFAFERA